MKWYEKKVPKELIDGLSKFKESMKLVNEDVKRSSESFNRMGKNLELIRKHEAEKEAQPHITNDLLMELNELLRKLIYSQTPQKINYAILILTFALIIIGLMNLILK